MNVCIDIRCLTEKYRTGVGEYTHELLDHLFKIDIDNQYFLFYNSLKDVSKIVPRWNYNHVHYVATKWPNKLFNLMILFGIIKLDTFVLKKIKNHINNNAAMQQCINIDILFSPNINFTRVSKKTKFILTIHDLSFELFKDCYSFTRRLWHKIVNPRRQCRRADLILTPSMSTRLDIMQEYSIDENKVKCVYPGLSGEFRVQSSEFRDSDSVRKKYNLSEKYLLYLGTLEPRKNISAIIDAFIEFKLRTISYELIIAGARGWNDEKIIEKIQSTPGVRYIGYVDAEDKSALYLMADLFVFPSLYEGFGFPVLEALACGTPVITSSRSSLPEISGSRAYLVNPYNISEIALGMETILHDTSSRDILMGERNILEHFSWENTAREVLGCFHDITNKTLKTEQQSNTDKP